MKKSLLFIFIFFLQSGMAFSHGSHDDTDETAIRHNREISNQALASRDVDAFLSVLMHDYHVVTSANLRLSGHDAQREMMNKVFSEYPDASYVRTPQVIELNSLFGSAAETGTWVGKWTRDGSEVEIRGSYYARWVRFEGQWLMQAEIFVPL